MGTNSLKKSDDSIMFFRLPCRRLSSSLENAASSGARELLPYCTSRTRDPEDPIQIEVMNPAPGIDSSPGTACPGQRGAELPGGGTFSRRPGPIGNLK